jgi:hypothetical protein
MVARLLNAADAAAFDAALQQLQRDIHDFRHPDAYQCWRVNRPAGWKDSTDVEAQALVESGTGRLKANGAGGPQTGEMVITIESPYRFTTLADAAIETGHLLVINGQRLFRVDLPKRAGETDLLMQVYVTELFQTPMPEGA